MDKRASSWDIYEAHDAMAPQASSVTPSGYLAFSPFAVSALFSDGGTGVDRASVAVTLNGSPLAGCTVTDSRVDCPVSGLAEGHYIVAVDLRLRRHAPHRNGLLDIDSQDR